MDDEDDVGAGFGREIGVAAESDTAIDVIAPTDGVGLEEAGDRRRRGHGLADRHVTQRALPEDRALGPVEIDGRNQERAWQIGKRVGQSLQLEALAHEALESDQREEPRRQVALGAGQHVGDGAPDRGHRVLAERPHHPPEAARGLPERVRREHGAPAEVQGIVEVLIEDPVQVAGPHAVGEERRDDRSGAAADVDVEATAFTVEPLFERGQRSDLVHAADDTPTAQGEGNPRRHPQAPREPPAWRVAHPQSYQAAERTDRRPAVARRSR